ncbi:MAG TPA: TadE/TadG family type IV pilus assembly protein [Acidobacteriaceae bacterium]
MNRYWKRARAEEGNTMVEFSLMAVMFIMLLLGVVEMGRMILVYTTIAHAAKYGARYAIVHGYLQSGTTNTTSTVTDIQSQVQSFSTIAPLTSSNVSVAVTYPTYVFSGKTYCGTNAVGCPVQVKVSYPFTPLLGYFNSMLSVTLSSTSEGAITY